MKILFIDDADNIDYQSDTVLHGLVTLGHDVTMANYAWYLAQPTSPGDKRLYGLGFSFAGTLPDTSADRRDNIRERILAHDFDLVVYGSISRCKDYLDDVMANYRRTEVVFIDGRDRFLDNPIDVMPPIDLVRHGLVFQREMVCEKTGVYPIHFGIPREKALPDMPEKTETTSGIVPGAGRRYRFTDEASYYAGYASARFAKTERRGGWDCMRHYEILANRCVPVFDINGLPPHTMVDWPRRLQREANALYEQAVQGDDVRAAWEGLEREFHEVFLKHMTTDCVAAYVLDVVARERDRPVDWVSKFDKVFCVHSTAQDFKLPRLNAELSRVGLFGNPVFEMRYTSPSAWDKVIRAAEPDPVAHDGVVNLGLETIRLLRESLNRGYNRILVLENDVTFLKDLQAIRHAVDCLPDRDIVQLDYFFCWYDPWKTNCATCRSQNPIGDGAFFDPKSTIFYSGGGIAYTRDAMGKTADFLEKRPTAPDGEIIKLNVTRAVATEQVVAQTVYSGCITQDVTSHHKGYELSGLDYSKYNFPRGYGPGSFINSETGEVMNSAGKKGEFFISVYAITKNESKFVDRWMDSMQEADEVVVLDTGSTDDTVEKLRARGAKVEVREFKPWRFDTSRNASMELCSHEADILVCTDLDEVLNKGWRKALETAWRKALDEGRNPTTASYWYTWNFTADGKPDRRFLYEKVHRPGTCKWTHPVHEILSYDGPKDIVFVEGMELEHYPDQTKSRGSYLGLLEMSVEEDPDDDRNMHYLGREYMFKGRWQDAIDTLKRHLELPRAKWRAERAASMRFMARCYAALGKDLTAELWYRRACDEEPSARESAVEFAQFLYDRKAPWPQLEAACERALRVTERAGSYLTEAEAWGSKPYDLQSIALWNLGRRDEALKAAEAALELDPGNERIKRNVDNIRKALPE